MDAQIEDLLQQVGDAICDTFNQMAKGDWRDDNDHPVRNNVAMLSLKDALAAMIAYRREVLGYENTGKTEET